MLVESQRFAEAAIWARAYLPSKLREATKKWQDEVRERGYLPVNLFEIPEMGEHL